MRITLGQAQSYQIAAAGDAIAISLSEDTQNFGAGFSPSWQLDVYAQTPEGKVYVGTLNTVAAVNGVFPARLIGFAVFPGARSWQIEATGPTSGPPAGGIYYAELRAHPVSEAPNGFGPGVFRPLGRTIWNGQVATSEIGQTTPSAPLANSRVDFTAPIVFAGAFGSNELPAGEIGSGPIWIMFFNASALPPNGTQPDYGLSFQVPVGGTFNFVVPQNAGFFSNGLVWAASSAANTLTLWIGGPAARVVTLAQW